MDHEVTLIQERSAWQPARLNGLVVGLTRGAVDSIEAVAEEWRSLLAEGPDDVPSVRPEWIIAHLRAREPGARVALVTVRRGGQLRGVLALVEERIRFYGLSLRRWRPPTVLTSPDPFDLVHGQGDRAMVVRATWDRLSAEPGWDLLELADVAPDSALAELHALAATAGCPVAARPVHRSPVLALPHDGDFAAAIAHVNAKFRATVRRRMRKLEGYGPVRFVRIETADQRWLERFFALEASGWKGRAGTAIACEPREIAFYQALAQSAAAHGYLTMYALECAGAPVAMHFGLTLGGRYLLPKVAFDETRADCSPGHVLLQEIIRDCASRGVREIDFMGHPDEWKRRWATGERAYNRLFVFRPSPIGQTAHALRFRWLPMAWRLREQLGGFRPVPVSLTERLHRARHQMSRGTSSQR